MTHTHPDHYGGVVEVAAGSDAPIIATAGVASVIRRDDAEKETILRPMFGDEWPGTRRFPDRTVEDGETVLDADAATQQVTSRMKEYLPG